MNEHTPESTVSLAPPAAAESVVRKIYQLISDGRAAEALPRLSELDGLGRGNPPMLNLTKGTILVDIASDLSDADLARRGVSLIKDVDPAGLPEPAQQAYWYNLGNGHGAIYNIRKIPSGVRRALDDDFGHAKKCYKQAMPLRAKSPESSARLYTNYGILLRTVGRHIEEIEAYDQALNAVPDFAMALWHQSKGLCWYSKLVESPTGRAVLIEARHLLKRSLGAGLEPVRKIKAEKELAELERILNNPETPDHRHTKHVADSDIETSYIRFCVDNRLYLHPCPVSSHEAYQDPLSVRFPTETKDEYLELRSDELALIKQEYIAARFLLFSYRHKQPDLSFVDRGAFLPSTGETKGHIYLQLLNLSFRAAYAILDKIAYFLNIFCKVGLKEDDIYFREEFFLGNRALRTSLAKYDGLQLAALFDVAREFSKGQPLYSLRNLRRKLEHRCLVLRSGLRAQEADRVSQAAARAAANNLSEDELYEASLRLLRVARAAVFYLFQFVRSSVDPHKAEAKAAHDK